MDSVRYHWSDLVAYIHGRFMMRSSKAGIGFLVLIDDCCIRVSKYLAKSYSLSLNILFFLHSICNGLATFHHPLKPLDCVL
jgi:hypothetical protein